MSFSDICGSVWRRWDPHIHVPGTVLNDQYGNDHETWDQFLERLKNASPAVEALGITDYYSLKGYKQVLAHKNAGCLPQVGLIFPNVEIRLGIGTSKGGAVNAHLLFSPEDPHHIAQIESMLGKLHFKTLDETYSCTQHDLMALGRKHKGASLPEDAAFAAGANQFKVDFGELKALWKSSTWLAENCLFAVAASEKDGSSGVRDEDDSLAMLRKDLERFASIIFSSQQGQIDFFLGKKAASKQDLEAKWGGLKPCLHGSDAHSIDRVAVPDKKRYCWVKGDLTFEALTHVCMEPETRVAIGETPPQIATGGRTIESVAVADAPWMTPTFVPLNPGLVAIIGARGSGKTALADLIAAGGFAARGQLNESSFLVRAKEHLGSGRVDLKWIDGDTTGNELSATDIEDLLDIPRVQYLSQQFVEKLCSADGATSALIEEIHRVLFNAHGLEEREGTNNFDELLQLRLEPALNRRQDALDRLNAAMSSLANERQLKAELPQLEKHRAEQAKTIEQDEKERKQLVGKGQEERAKRHQAIQEALEGRRRLLEKAQEEVRTLKALAEDVNRFRTVQAPALLSNWKETRAAAGLLPAEWQGFSLKFVGDVDSLLKEKLAKAEASVKSLAGTPVPPERNRDPIQPFIPEDANLAAQTVARLAAEADRLNGLIGVDKQNVKRLAALSEKILKAKKAREALDKRIQNAKTADERISRHLGERRAAYESIFKAVADIESEYHGLYAPLQRSLRDAGGSLGKLGMAVKRLVDIEGWAAQGEQLLDLRKQGPFRGKGSLLDEARKALLPAWLHGCAAEIADAMQDFARANEAAIKDHKPEEVEARPWIADVARWLHDTSHVTVSYALTYDGVEIDRLSPGTRGVVLLLLYLTIDQEDDRPLIIDQPEENLDPKSVYDELVHRFRLARERRQVIIVTHNANLVVNTDADQVIVAEASGHAPGRLPNIRYISGGLENRQIRKHVCDVLEGGERAFRDRAKRLRLKLGEQPEAPQAPEAA